MRSLRRTAWIAAAAIAVAGLVAVPLADAASPAYSAKGKVFGRKTADWVADWWQWTLSLPITSNPLTNESGTFTGVGQHGRVWFFTWFSDPSSQTRPVSLTRSAEVPAGRALLFPLMTTFNIAGDLDLAQWVSGIDVPSLVFELDGAPLTDIAKRRVTTRTFEIPIVPNGLIAGTEGTVRPSIASDGYWVMLKPLTTGNHTVHIKSNRNGTTFDVTYNLTVVAVQ